MVNYVLYPYRLNPGCTLGPQTLSSRALAVKCMAPGVTFMVLVGRAKTGHSVAGKEAAHDNCFRHEYVKVFSLDEPNITEGL